MKQRIYKMSKLISTLMMTTVMLLALSTNASAATLTVPSDYGTIQAAIDAANPGDIVLVNAGLYEENVHISKADITMRSQSGNPDDTIVKAVNMGDPVLDIRANNVTVFGFNLTGTQYDAGIYLEGVTGCTIDNNTLSNNFFGIAVAYSSNNTLTSNKAFNNKQDGIQLIHSSNNTLTKNTLSNNPDGIYLATNDNNNILTSNTVSNNKHGILAYYSTGNMLTDNTVSNNPGSGILMQSCTSSTLTGNKITNANTGIYFYNSNNNLIYNNYLANSQNVRDYPGTNTWNITKTAGKNIVGGKYLGGNYYASYTGVDTDGDGLGDTPYNSGMAGSADYLPLVIPTVTNQPPVANIDGSDQAVEGSAITFNGSASSDPDGDTLQYSWDFGDGSTESGIVIPQHVYADNGEYTVTLNVTDSDGEVGTDTLIVTVSNAYPVLGGVVSPLDPYAVNTPVSVSLTFTDAGILDTHTAVLDWGDGAITTGTIVENNGAGTVTGEHAYEKVGVYWVQLNVSDNNGGNASATSEYYVVIYDPESGFVTGGGWIDSPAGSYAPDPGLTGKATFGFASKYQEGATVPTGNTEFQFKVANLNFKSTSYDWLVVAGAQAKFKGTGTINGAGEYGFMLSAVDGAIKGDGIDRLRIKILDKGTDAVVYDNEIGVSEDTEPSTAIGSGSVVVHKVK